MMMGRPPRPLRERFDEKYEIVEPGGCWVWMANGERYGHLHVGSRVDGSRRTVAAHRTSWELHRGSVPEGLHVLHRCDNSLCVNPEHLFLGTHADNMADREAKGRSPVGEDHPKAKLTNAQVLQIRLIGRAISQVEIGRRFGVSVSLVGHILNGIRRVGRKSSPSREVAL